MGEAIELAFLLDVITTAGLVIIGILFLKLFRSNMKRMQSDVGEGGKYLYAPYHCEEETDTLLVLSNPIRIVRFVANLGLLFLVAFYLLFSEQSFAFKPLYWEVVGCLIGSLMDVRNPIKIIVTPGSVELTYSYFLFPFIRRLHKREINYLVLNRAKSILWQSINVSIVKSSRTGTVILELVGQDKNKLLDSSKAVSERFSKILGVPLMPYRAG